MLDRESVIVRTHHINRWRDWKGRQVGLVDYIEGIGRWEKEQGRYTVVSFMLCDLLLDIFYRYFVVRGGGVIGVV